MDPGVPKTPYEEMATESYKILSQLRFRSGTIIRNLSFCFDRCLDTEELYTLYRSQNAPISYRLKKDMEEKKCIQYCSGKWDDLLPQIVTESNERIIYETQAKVFQKMLASMEQQGPQ